jgi:protein O-GlcNAc transferase
MRTRLKLAFDRFIDVHDQSDRDAARLIRELEVDIVVDLGGFTSGSRPAIVAFRPAPIQVTYLSYPGIMGAGCIDYILADRFVIPEDHRSLLSERVVYLPNAYLGYDSAQNISEQIPSRTEQGLPETGFVFCAYNNTFKIMPQVFDIWMRLLRTVSGSVLWLMGTNATAVSNLRREAQARGVDPDRLCFAPYVQDVADHLARYRLADLFLDTLPFNAQTTACDALWAGLPVLTRLGSTFVGRAAASLLSAIDMPELITHSAEEYEALALKLATDAPYLAAIRRKLADHRLTTPLFDSELFTRHVEAAYSHMIERHRAGLPPDHLVIPH